MTSEEDLKKVLSDGNANDAILRNDLLAATATATKISPKVKAAVLAHATRQTPIDALLVNVTNSLKIASPVSSVDAMPTAAPLGWSRVFQDDFINVISEGNFPATTTGWAAYPNTWLDTSKRGRYSPEIISQHDSCLDIHMRTENGVIKVAAPYPTLGGVRDRASLRVSVRFKADVATGFKTAWLLWPQGGAPAWPKWGEIDFPEGNLDGTIKAFMHRQDALTGADQDGFSTNETYPVWHIATTEWIAGVSCNFILNGVVIGNVISRVPAGPMHWVGQCETVLLPAPAPLPGASSHILIDWITVDTLAL